MLIFLDVFLSFFLSRKSIKENLLILLNDMRQAVKTHEKLYESYFNIFLYKHILL